MKTPEQMAEEHVIEKYPPLREESEPKNYLNVMIWERKTSFLAGYKAAKPEWISVKERLPEVNTWCLWLYPFGPEVNQYEGIGKGGALLFHRDYYNCDDTPTHWMPLPEPPKGEE